MVSPNKLFVNIKIQKIREVVLCGIMRLKKVRKKLKRKKVKTGPDRIRTGDLLFTRQAL